MPSPDLGGRHETARVHHPSRRCGGTWPPAARAQPGERMRRIGVLLSVRRRSGRTSSLGGVPERAARNWDGPTAAMCRSTPLERGMSTLRTLRSGTGRARRRTLSWPAAITCGGVQQATRTVPIVFTGVPDPVGAGRRDLARPGGNTTGFTPFEYSIECEMAGAAQGDRARA